MAVPITGPQVARYYKGVIIGDNPTRFIYQTYPKRHVDYPKRQHAKTAKNLKRRKLNSQIKFDFYKLDFIR